MLNKEILMQQYEDASLIYPKLLPPREFGSLFSIDGSIDIIDENGYCWGVYEVRILFPEKYPERLPILIETSQLIERHIDWHISELGVCCVGTEAQQYRMLGKEIKLENWLSMFVVPYFANHIHRKLHGNYANGELSHGPKGIYEDYSEWLKLTNVSVLVTHMRMMAGKVKQAKNVECFCGSGKIYKRCFELNPQLHLNNIPLDILEHDILKIESWGRLKENLNNNN